jgi:hypothetical protein
MNQQGPSGKQDTQKCACGQEFPTLDDLSDHLSMSFPLPRDDIGVDGERHYEIAPNATRLQTGAHCEL